MITLMIFEFDLINLFWVETDALEIVENEKHMVGILTGIVLMKASRNPEYPVKVHYEEGDLVVMKAPDSDETEIFKLSSLR